MPETDGQPPNPAGAAAPTQQATPTATPAAIPTPTSAAPTGTMNPMAEVYQQLIEARSKLAEIEAAKRQELEAKETSRLKALAEKGEIERALSELRQKKDEEIREARTRVDSLEASILTERKSSTLTSSLLGTVFRSQEAAEQVNELLERRLEAVRDPVSGAVSVREKGTGRPASDFVKEWLASKAADHFLAPTTTGGAGAGGTHRPGETPKDDPTARRLEQIRAGMAQQSRGAVGLRGQWAQSSN
jgi:hypothetical protein